MLGKGRPPTKSVNPDESVALGAALQVGVLTGKFSGEFSLMSYISLRVLVGGSAISKLVGRGSPVPATENKSLQRPEVTRRLSGAMVQGGSLLPRWAP